MVSDPLDELAAEPDVISSGGEDFSAFVVSRWPGLVRLAFGLTGDRWAAEDIAQATLARAYVAWRRVRRADDPDASDLLFPDPGDGADVAIGAAAPGIGFAFVQVPDGIDGLLVNGQESVPAIEVTVCGQHYRLVGLAYRLKHPPRLTAQYAGPGWPKTKRSTEGGSPDGGRLPAAADQHPAAGSGPQTDGLWNHVRPVSAKPTRALLASGRAWSIELIFGVAGDCYEFTSPGSPGDPEMSVCGPISTPEGPETIMAMPLSYPPIGLKAPTGYAVQVSPRTADLRATASDGSTQLVTPRVVDGRRYAAFVIGTSLRLERLTWLDATGKAFASTTSLPLSGYTQFQP